jgi:hypothetical protein
VENELYTHDYVGMQSNGIMDTVYVAAPYCHAAAVVVEVLQAPVVIIVAVVLVTRMI